MCEGNIHIVLMLFEKGVNLLPVCSSPLLYIHLDKISSYWYTIVDDREKNR